MDAKTITLSGIADGAAEELFQDALRQVLRNIEDPNTDHRTSRKIGLTFIFSCDEERRVGAIETKVSTKLAGIKGVKTHVFFGKHEGVPVVVEQPTQEEMFPKPQGKPRPVEAAQGGNA